MTSELLANIMACPVCGYELSLNNSDSQVQCSSCGAIYAKGAFIWNFVPRNIDWQSPMWKTWKQLQDNGVAGYQADPEHNLSVIEREDIKQFTAFCHCRGLVLDIGCGPQPWPAYFERRQDVMYVGIDPLIDDLPGEYLRVQGLGEFLPFRSEIFDHILFGTSLDHFVDPVIVLRMASRVCKLDGEIDVWLGEKQPDAPRPATSPDWYRRLQKPALANDLFHFKRLTSSDFVEIVNMAHLKIVETGMHEVDEYRTNHFYRLKRRIGI